MVEYEEMTTEIEKVVEPEALALQWKATSSEEFKSFLADARVKARMLMEVVEGQKLYTEIGGKKHLHLEAWRLLGDAYGLVPAIVDDPIELVNGGFRAKAVLHDQSTGRFVSSAFSECGSRGDGIWVERPDFTQISMAQTRATSKAFRICLSSIVVLAGYSPTPYEEMPSDAGEKPIAVITQGKKVIPLRKDEPTDKMGVPCPIHVTQFWEQRFNKNPGYHNELNPDGENWSHKLDDGWCNIKPSIINDVCLDYGERMGWNQADTKKWIFKKTDGKDLWHVGNAKLIDILQDIKDEAAVPH